MWDPHLVKHFQLLEKFTLKVCTKSWNQPYDTLLSQMQLPRLEQRRVQLKLSFLYKLVHNLAFCPQVPLNMFHNMSVSIVMYLFLLNRPICHTISHHYSFYPHTNWSYKHAGRPWLMYSLYVGCCTIFQLWFATKICKMWSHVGYALLQCMGYTEAMHWSQIML